MNPAFIVACLGVLLGAAPLLGQDDPTLEVLLTRTLRYEAAEDAHQAALTARQVVQGTFDSSLDSVQIARTRGDQEAFDRASEQNMLLARELSRMDRRVEATSDTLQLARREVLNAMDARTTVLLERRDAANTRAEAQRVDALIQDLANQYYELEQSSDILTPQPLAFSGVLAYSPRDPPSRLAQKIELATREIEKLENRISEADDRIQGIEQRIRLARRSDDFQSSLGRFDDTRVPVGPPGQTRPQGDPAVTDSTGVRTQPQSLEEQLEGWQTLRRQLEGMLDAIVAAREELQAHIGAVPGSSSSPGAV